MLLILLILFTKVLAESEEDKYVDLLPDAEKQQFIEKVARRILKDVQSQENRTNAESGEMSDDQLKKHTEYVKAILKEEADYGRRSKGEAVKDKPASEEKEAPDAKPLESEKMSVADDPDVELVDLTLRNDRRTAASIEPATDFIKVEVITDKPIIKRSVQDDNANKTIESDENTSEILERVNSGVEKSAQIEMATEKTENVNELNVTTTAKAEVATNTTGADIVTTTTEVVNTTNETKVVSTTTKEPLIVELTNFRASELNSSINESLTKVVPMAEKTEQTETKSNDTKTETTQKSLNLVESTTVGDQDDEIELVEGKHSGSGESDAEDILVKGIEEPWARKSNNDAAKSGEKSTEIDTTTNTHYKSDEYNNVSSADEEFTTLTYPSKSSTANNNSSESASIESTSTHSTTTHSTSTHRTTTTTDSTTTERTTTTTKFEAAEPIMKSRTDSLNDTQNELDATTEYSSESTLTSTMTDEGTTELVTESTTFTPSTKSPTTEAETTNFTPLSKIEDMKIIVEEFTSAPPPTGEYLPLKSTRTSDKQFISKKKKHAVQSVGNRDVTTKRQDDHEISGEANNKNAKQKVIVHKLEKVIIGPQGHKAGLKKSKTDEYNRDRNFIELEKVYYNNNYKVKTPKGYHVYEVPAGKSPFIEDDGPMTEQPYFVPIYNYSPNNAYFNPQNRLGPNTGDSKEKIGAFTIDDTDISPQPAYNAGVQIQEQDYTDSAIDNKRKKFGNKPKLYHSIHKQPQNNNQENKKRDQVNPEDYLDSDYYFGRVRKDSERRANQEDFYTFPNSDENDHPAHSIQEGNLKDHVRAVRNILFHQKSFGLLDKDKYGRESNEMRSDKRKREKKENNLKKRQALRTGPNKAEASEGLAIKEVKKYKPNKNKETENNIAIDYYYAKDQKPVLTTDIKKIGKSNNHFQKVGYLKNLNNTKELYVMDEFFKENVMKYIQDQKNKNKTYSKSDLKPATPYPTQGKIMALAQSRDDEITNFREQEKQRNAALMKISQISNAYKKTLRIADEKNDEHNKNANKTVKQDVSKEGQKGKNNNTLKPAKEQLNLKLNHRRNDVVKVGVYLEVLKDMILSFDNNALKQYDWLGSTVDIQSALQKLFELTALVANEDDVHPADMEILKYVVFLHKLASEIIEANDFGAQLRNKLALPRNKKKKLKPRLLKEKGLINRVWLYLRKEVPQVNEDGALKNLNKFLMDIEDALYDLHDAIKHIAKITKYKNQHWYQNLKDLYINTDDKHLLEILLHMTALRLFSLIEESAKNGLEDDYVEYMKSNRKEAKKTLEEIMFVMQILEEYNKFVH